MVIGSPFRFPTVVDQPGVSKRPAIHGGRSVSSVEGNQAHQISHVTVPNITAPVSEPAINMSTPRKSIAVINTMPEGPKCLRAA